MTPPTTPDPQRPPRAFAQGTGVMLQTVGMILFLSGCCVCSGIGVVNNPLLPNQVARLLQDNPDLIAQTANPLHNPARFGVMAMVMFSTVGGLALAVTGLGLQTDQPHGGWASTLAAAGLSIALLLAGYFLWSGRAPWPMKIWHLLLNLLAFVLTAFCLAAWRQVRAHPPPRGFHVVRADELDEL